MLKRDRTGELWEEEDEPTPPTPVEKPFVCPTCGGKGVVFERDEVTGEETALDCPDRCFELELE
jgi:hypothetical protein